MRWHSIWALLEKRVRIATTSAWIFLLWLAATIIAAGQTMAVLLQTADTAACS